MSEKIHKVVSLNPSGITILPERMRQLREEVVTGLAESIQQRGQLQPIIVRPRPRGGMGYILVAGWHRLMAIRALKRDSIDAYVFDGLDADLALLAEIDENLIRADLSPAERALHIGRRKELYEVKYPETVSVRKRGGPGRGKRKENQSHRATSFIDDTAAKTGKHRATIARDAARAEGCVVLSEIAGTCLDKPDEIDALCKLPEKEQRILAKAAKKGKKVSAKTRAKQIKRESRERELGQKQLALPTKKYGVIVTDDAWDFEVWSRETGMDRHAANHYTVESVRTSKPSSHPEIPDKTAIALHEKTKDRFTCADEDCVLAMWTTAPFHAIATDLMRLRGFHYRSQTMWRKIRPGQGRGTGYWFINEHELLLVGTRGNVPAPAPGTQWPSVIEAPVGEHSEKPEVFLQMLEEYFPNLPKIEFNRRGPPRSGWYAWGNEAEMKEAAE